ncbi:hypothetical protein GCM10007860_03260 [Chitiniphilus shinanonensis]|uniref:Uncharacterized protein n=1 Tax=Chitiniphilus shinanonensis TaxID=553088 RepID=A0ABQ6BTH5_9NEIS|nr:hypothetical protein [Chitiniphilus shinanonensis]GLS03183.1 hypothetical protein GCM10007860_03260 [Chitiniphilus shinanonensis]
MEHLELQQAVPATPVEPSNRRIADRRAIAEDDEEALWRWTNMLLNGNERRSGDERRRLDS